MSYILTVTTTSGRAHTVDFGDESPDRSLTDLQHAIYAHKRIGTTDGRLVFISPAAVESIEVGTRDTADGAYEMTDETRADIIAMMRSRLVDDDDSLADVDIIMTAYTAMTGEEIAHPYDDDRGDDNQ